MTVDTLSPPQRGKHDKEARQRALIEAGMEVFADRGYDAATTREVASRAGCSEGLIHRYFNGKRGLMLAVIESRDADVAEDFRTGVPVCDGLAEEVEAILLWHLAMMWERQDFMRVCCSRAIIDPELGLSIGAGINQQRVRLIVERLERYRKAGKVQPDVDLESVGHMLAGIGFASGFFAQIVFEMDRQEVRRSVVEAAKVIARGIAL
jgi:AcrR family transcriptional regulator